MIAWSDSIEADTALAYWIAFGPHGPRAKPPPGESRVIFLYTLYGLAAATVLFGAIRFMARPSAPTMSKEWQEATEEYMKVSPSALPHAWFYRILTPGVATKDGAHHWPTWHDDPEPVQA
jgi:hypothetical protein